MPVYDLGAAETWWIPTQERAYEFLDWSPDGCYVAYLAGGGAKEEGRIRVVNVHTLTDSLLATTSPGSRPHVGLCWSPTGEWIVYSFGIGSERQANLIRSDGTGSRQLFSGVGIGGIVGWTRDGRYLIYWSHFPSPQAEALPLEGVWLLNRLDLGSMRGEVVARLSQPLERWADLIITDVSTLRPVPLGMPEEPDQVLFVDLFWTPDFLHFAIRTARDCGEGCGGANLYLLDVESGQVQQVNAKEFGMGSFSQSWDGTRLAFEATYLDEASAEDDQTYLLDITTGKIEVLGQKQGLVLWMPSWSPDGTMLSFNKGYNTNEGSFVYHLSTGEISRLGDVVSSYGWPLGWSPRMSYGAGACEGGK